MSSPPNNTADPESRRVVAITGASGLLGRHLVRAFAARGHRVRALVRDPSRASFGPGVEVFPFEMPDRIDPASIEGAGVVIHNAYALGSIDVAKIRRTNEEGTRRLRDAVRRSSAATRFVFVSSLSAHEDARSAYGLSKLALEREMDPEKDLVIRPGLVLAPDGGLFQVLVRLVRRSPVIPLFDGGVQVIQTIHVDDLMTAFVRAIEEERTGTLTLGDPAGVTLREILRRIAVRLGRRPVFVTIPTGPVLAGLRALEGAGMKLSFGSENVLGVTFSARAPTAGDLARLRLDLRPLDRSIEELALREESR